MNTLQFLTLLVSILVGGPVIYWLIANRNENAVWSGSLSLILDDDSLVRINKHGTFILPSSDCAIRGFILHGVPVGRIPFINIYTVSNELVEAAIARGQNIYHNVATDGDVKFRFTRMIRPQHEFELRFMTDQKLQNAPNFFKQGHSYGGGIFFESAVCLRWPKDSVPYQS